MRSFILYCCLLLALPASMLARLAIYGDTRSNPTAHARIVEQIASHKPDYIFHTGDLNEKGTQQEEYDLFMSVVAPLGSGNAFFPVRGNHDQDRDLFLNNFPHLNGSSWYSVVRDSIRFIMLDSVESLKPGDIQYAWLENELKSTGSLPVIIILHHPIFSSGAHGPTPGLALYLTHLFESNGVVAVFSGHEHSYERSVFNGITYVVTGGGGAPLREAKHTNPYSKTFYSGHHYIICDREAGVLKLRAIAEDGNIIDETDIPLSQ